MFHWGQKINPDNCIHKVASKENVTIIFKYLFSMLCYTVFDPGSDISKLCILSMYSMCLMVGNSVRSFSYFLLQLSRITMATPHDFQPVEEIRDALKKNNPALAIAKIQEYLDKQNNTTLNIAITGESGSGKSTFINAFRGVDNKAEGAAPTGCVETT